MASCFLQVVVQFDFLALQSLTLLFQLTATPLLEKKNPLFVLIFANGVLPLLIENHADYVFSRCRYYNHYVKKRENIAVIWDSGTRESVNEVTSK